MSIPVHVNFMHVLFSCDQAVLIPAKPTRNRQKPQNFQRVGQLSAADNVAEDTVKPVGFMSGSFRVRFAMESPDLRPIDN